MTQFALTYSILNHVNVYVLDGTLLEKRLAGSGRSTSTNAARRLSCGYIKIISHFMASKDGFTS